MVQLTGCRRYESDHGLAELSVDPYSDGSCVR